MTAAHPEQSTQSEQFSFCELAPLYVLDMLEPVERAWIEQQVTADPDLAAELRELEATSGTLAYSLPQPPLATDLQERLFAALNLTAPTPEPITPLLPSEFPFVVRAQDWQWQPQATPGIEIALFYTDEIKREMVGVLRAQPGVRYPMHRHAALEELYMLEGDLIDGTEVYGPGDYIRSVPGTAHAPYTEGGCMFFFRSSLDDEYLEEPDELALV